MQSELIFKRQDKKEDIKIIIEYQGGRYNIQDTGLYFLYSIPIQSAQFKYEDDNKTKIDFYNASIGGLSTDMINYYLNECITHIKSYGHRDDYIEVFLKMMSLKISNK